jgi:hypothetical protein
LYKETPKRFWWLNFCDSKEDSEIDENGSSNAGKNLGHHFPIVLEKTPIKFGHCEKQDWDCCLIYQAMLKQLP